MNKKVIGIIIAVIIILATIIGIVYLVSNDSLNKENTSNDNSKTLGTTIQSEENEQTTLNKQNEQAIVNENKVENNINQNMEKSDKILIAYFSRADENYNVGTVSVGNTEIMAGFIKDYLGNKADTFKIEEVTPYPTSYEGCKTRATEELNSNARPEFKNAKAIDLSKYDTILIGYPIWWGDVPMIINTFLEKYDFSGKTIIPFNTHEGSGNSGTYTSIKNKMKSANVNTNGLAIRGTEARKESSRSTVENWLKGLGL